MALPDYFGEGQGGGGRGGSLQKSKIIMLLKGHHKYCKICDNNYEFAVSILYAPTAPISI